MEEKVLVKGNLGGKFLVVIMYILAITPSALGIIMGIADDNEEMLFVAIPYLIVMIIFAIIINAILNKRELVVTNKRVIARGAFSFRVDIPIEKVTHISSGFFGKIGCGSPSRKIRFAFCKNKMEIFDTLAAETLKRDSAILDEAN